MRFRSTRGRSPDISFREAVLSGLAPDGGLYMPEFWPAIPADEQAQFRRMTFPEVASRVLARFAGPEMSGTDLMAMAERAFSAFDVVDVAPIRQFGADDFLLELFHGPTLAFKDIAMRMLAELYAWAIGESARGKTILGATSGDTGAAAASAFAGFDKAEVFMLHPKGRISDVQRRMMTTIGAENIVNIAVEGDFDDCQRLVKTLFADCDFNRVVDLGGVNSINWVRLAVQIVYYFTAVAAVGAPASFVVPTGNFGDAFAGYAAKRMSLPVDRLCIAVNSNDILKRAIDSGVYEPAPAQRTTSPAMDIQIASNFERLLFEMCGRNGDAVSDLMAAFERDRRMALPEAMRRSIAAELNAERAGDDEVAAEMRAFDRAHGMLVDPHTAVGLVALKNLRKAGVVNGKAVALATAHPAKFPDAVEKATGVRPKPPRGWADRMDREERMVETAADAGAVRAVVESRSRFIERGSA